MTPELAWRRMRMLPAVLGHLRVSFSQYAEDMLLTQMEPQRTGFYVDVGAYQPRDKSNTYKLYLRGWSGLTIEPNPDAAAAFRKERPRDTHVVAGVASTPGELTYYRFEQAPLNTFDAHTAQQHADQLRDRLRVPCVPLTSVLDEHHLNRPIDLLSVDCEKYDLDVLASLDWERYRPSLVIVEDFEGFWDGAQREASRSAIRAFLLTRDYAVASQAVFSFYFVDRHAFGRPPKDSGFRLDRSQLTDLALHAEPSPV